MLVCNDLLSFDLSFTPRFLKRYARFEEIALQALQHYAEDVRAGAFPADEHSFARAARGA